MAPHRATLILVLGIIGLVTCPPLGIAAWVLGWSDLRKMKLGTMDAEGRPLTQVGMVLGIVSTVIFLLLFIAVAFAILIPAVVGASKS